MLPLSIQAQYYQVTVKFPITFTVGNNDSPSILRLFAKHFHTHNCFTTIFVTILMRLFVSSSLSFSYELTNFFFSIFIVNHIKVMDLWYKNCVLKIFSFLLFTVYKVMVSCTQSLRAFTAVELKSYNAILAPPIYQKCLAVVEAKL